MAAPIVAPSGTQAITAPSSGGALPAAATAASASAAPAFALPPDPTSVAITVRGPPTSAEVWLGDKLLGKAPGPVELAFGRNTVELTVSAEGHEALKLALVPDRSLELDVELKKLPRPNT